MFVFLLFKRILDRFSLLHHCNSHVVCHIIYYGRLNSKILPRTFPFTSFSSYLLGNILWHLANASCAAQDFEIEIIAFCLSVTLRRISISIFISIFYPYFLMQSFFFFHSFFSFTLYISFIRTCRKTNSFL